MSKKLENYLYKIYDKPFIKYTDEEVLIQFNHDLVTLFILISKQIEEATTITPPKENIFDYIESDKSTKNMDLSILQETITIDNSKFDFGEFSSDWEIEVLSPSSCMIVVKIKRNKFYGEEDFKFKHKIYNGYMIGQFQLDKKDNTYKFLKKDYHNYPELIDFS